MRCYVTSAIENWNKHRFKAPFGYYNIFFFHTNQKKTSSFASSSPRILSIFRSNVLLIWSLLSILPTCSWVLSPKSISQYTSNIIFSVKIGRKSIAENISKDFTTFLMESWYSDGESIVSIINGVNYLILDGCNKFNYY